MIGGPPQRGLYACGADTRPSAAAVDSAVGAAGTMEGIPARGMGALAGGEAVQVAGKDQGGTDVDIASLGPSGWSAQFWYACTANSRTTPINSPAVSARNPRTTFWSPLIYSRT